MEATMGKIPIVAKNKGPSDKDPQQPRECYVIARPLPIFYMSDYSVLGLLVDKLEEAVGVLGRNHFSVIEDAGDIEVAVDAPGRLPEIVQILKKNGIRCEIADVVGGIYQG
jgi:hypothetical protein